MKMSKFNAFLFGSFYNSDERVRAGIDKAGNISFIFLFFCLFIGMIYGLLADNLEISLLSMFLFFGGGIVNIIFRIKYGSIGSAENQPNTKRNRLKNILAYISGTLVYAILRFFSAFKISDHRSSEFILKTIKSSLIEAFFWILIFSTLMALIHFASKKQIKKQITDEEE